uniref:Putative secreted protein n=1 Tax=Anopheles marajoara TaxID=58244 RepID=A0A2M4C844_9DIPT
MFFLLFLLLLLQQPIAAADNATNERCHEDGAVISSFPQGILHRCDLIKVTDELESGLHVCCSWRRLVQITSVLLLFSSPVAIEKHQPVQASASAVQKGVEPAVFL